MKALLLLALCRGSSALDTNAESSRILGWYSWDGRWMKSECPPQRTFAAHSTFVGCEAGQHATACESNKVMYSGGSTSDCDLDRCETATVFESSGGKASSAFLCYATAAFRPEPRTFYRNTFDFAASTTTPGPSSTAGSTAVSISTEKTSSNTPGTSGTSAGGPSPGITSHTSSGPATSASAGTSGGTAAGAQPTSSAGGTPTVALAGGRAVLWAGVTTVLMMGLGAVMFI